MERDGVSDWIALNLLPGLGPVTVRRALERWPDPSYVAYRASSDALAGLGRIRTASLKGLARARNRLRDRAERERALAERHGFAVLVPGGAGFPPELDELPDGPLVLYRRGELRAGVSRIAVVGSRTPTPYGRRVAAGLGSALAARGVEVVSGGARGIDRHAHEAALDEDGRTVAVTGSGLLRPYPPEHAALYDRIAACGAVLSEFPLEAEAVADHFPRRNRIIAGLAAAVVVVEAARRSGALNTAGHALDYGREVMAVPGPVSSAKSAGCHALIQQGAKLVQNVEDILGELSPMYAGGIGSDPAVALPPRLDGLTPDETVVLGMVERTEPVHLDRLAEEAPFGIARLQAALFGLEVRGAVDRYPGRYYVLAPKKEP